MKLLRRHSAPRRVVAILAAIAVCVIGLPGAALCVGSDGHLAVEPLGSECGPPAATAAAPNASAPLFVGASLHGCTDTALGAPSLHGHSDPGRRVLCTPVCALIVPAPAGALGAGRPHGSLAELPADPLSRRTTVLLL